MNRPVRAAFIVEMSDGTREILTAEGLVGGEYKIQRNPSYPNYWQLDISRFQTPSTFDVTVSLDRVEKVTTYVLQPGTATDPFAAPPAALEEGPRHEPGH